MMLIKAVSLQKEFVHGDNRTHAVKDGSLEMTNGESIAITGPSGCGKTTMINMIGLILTPSKGELYIEGKDAKTFSAKQTAEYRNKFFGYIVQDFALLENYTVRKNVEIPLLYSSERLGARERKKRVQEVLTKVGLTDKINVLARNLSGGQRQRVAIARALVNNPQVILADEPTGSLDSETGQGIIKLIMDLVAEGKGLLMVTHNPEIARQCDYQINMIDGMTNLMYA